MESNDLAPVNWSLSDMTQMNQGTLMENLGIEYLEVTVGLVKARMPVDQRTLQPFGFLHGGATAALAETLGSLGSVFLLGPGGGKVFGIELNVSHLRKVARGYVYGEARLQSSGSRTHVWEIRVEDEQGELVALSRLTVLCILPHSIAHQKESNGPGI